MARELLICWAGRHRRDDWERLCARYRARIERHWPIRDLPVKAARSGSAGGSAADRRRAEGRALYAALPEPCWPVALDRKGKARSSVEWASWLRRLREEWPHPIAFLIGSDLGLDKEAMQAARERISFGPLTLPHELARLVLYEQIYRVSSIDRGIKYHRG